MKICLQCMMLFAFMCGSNSDDVKCNPLQFFTNSFLDVTASNSATEQNVTMMDKIMTTSREQCLEACCNQISDGCTVAVFSEMDAECYLYQCSPVDRCVVSSSDNNTTIFIGQTSTTSTESGFTIYSTQASTTVPLSQTTEVAKVSTVDQSTRTTSTPVKVIHYLGNTMSSSTDSQETITTQKYEEAVQTTNSTVGHDTADVNQMKESLNNIPTDLSTPVQKTLKKTTVADDKSSEKSSLTSTTVEHGTTPDNPKQTSSTKGPATLATLSKHFTSESQVPPPTSSSQNDLATESATSFFSAGSTTVSKTEEGVRTTEAVQTTESTSITMNVTEIITEKMSTENIITTDFNSTKTTTTESNTPTSRTTNSYVTHTSILLTTNRGTTSEDEALTAVTTSNSQTIQASSVTLLNQTDHMSSTENTQLQSVMISITNTTLTMGTSTDELIKELHQLSNTNTTQSNTSELIVINKQGADQIMINNTLPSIDFSEDLVVSGALIAALSFGILFFFAMMILVGRRCFEGWKRRHYSRIDYLVNGMYN
ncbi:hypothetical protein ACJMK2_029700 [Sinanodonta woodiana]|uniref:MANSC domain-containing protein n=1 Tax=Sinanodonta woodiana TaxID=1069815 RepID=A0ABD3XBI3_SINWO